MKDILDKNTWDRPYAVLGWGSLTFAFLSAIVFFAAYGGTAWWVIYYARPDGQISTEWASCYCIYLGLELKYEEKLATCKWN